MCMPNYFSSTLKNIYITRFPGCLLFQSRALCPQSVSSGLRMGGFGSFCNLCSFESCTAKCQTLVALHVPRGQRTVTAPWPRSLREAGSLGSGERHFQGQAMILQTTAASAGSSRNKVSKCWGLEPFPGCSSVNLQPRDSLVPAGALQPRTPGGTPRCSRLYVMVGECSHGLGRDCSEITRSLVFAALLLQGMAMVAVTSSSCSRVPLV